MTLSAIPLFPSPSLYAGDFNCRHVDWGCNTPNSDGNCLAEWAANNNLAVLYDPKGPSSFNSGRWGMGTNPDLAFTSVEPNSWAPDRRVLEKFPRSQHQPSLILVPLLLVPIPSAPVKRWNFLKANWKPPSVTMGCNE